VDSGVKFGGGMRGGSLVPVPEAMMAVLSGWCGGVRVEDEDALGGDEDSQSSREILS
jgi:hypothetical protein